MRCARRADPRRARRGIAKLRFHLRAQAPKARKGRFWAAFACARVSRAGAGGKASDFVGVPGSASTFLSAYIAPPGRSRRLPTRTCEEALSPTEWGLESICGANRYLPLHPTPKVASAKLARHDPRRKRGHPIAHLPGHCYLRAKCKVGMGVASCGRARKAGERGCGCLPGHAGACDA